MSLKFSDLVRVVDEDGVAAYHVSFARAKQMTSNTTDGDLAILKCPLGVKAVDTYLALFPPKTASLPENRSSKLWRRLAANSYGLGKVTVTWRAQAIGKGTTKKFGFQIATALKLPNPEAYTGHCWRRSSATLAANAGLSLAQIKALTGHHSDTVVQRYIERSLPMKLAAADGTACVKESALPCSQPTSQPSQLSTLLGKRPSTSSASSGAPVYNIQVTIAGNQSGSLGLFGK